MQAYPYWDTPSCILYLLQGALGAVCFCRFRSRPVTLNAKSRIIDGHILLWGCVWVFFAAFRMVGSGIGGSDAANYVFYFENCLGEMPAYYKHFDDLLYALINRFLRLFFSDYHIYFILLYGFMFAANVLFIDTFCPRRTSYIPYLLIFFVWLRGYTSIRSNLGIAFILLSLVFLYRKRNLVSFLLAAASVLCHKSCVLYAAYVVFYFLFSRRRSLNRLKSVLLLLACAWGARFLQQVFVIITEGVDLGGVYRSYAQKSIGVSFFDNFWKIAFEQMLLGALMVFLYPKVCRHAKTQSPEDRRRILFVWNACVYDMILIPITFTFNIWRGYEFFYVPRLVMWGILLHVAEAFFSIRSRKILNIVLGILFASWFVFRLANTFDSSCLLPYVLKLF